MPRDGVPRLCVESLLSTLSEYVTVQRKRLALRRHRASLLSPRGPDACSDGPARSGGVPCRVGLHVQPVVLPIGSPLLIACDRVVCASNPSKTAGC